jgi:ATP-dependent DNA helicase Rep
VQFPLNAAQTAAVKYTKGPLLVLAGAGSGKTRVITAKIGHLIEHCGYAAANIAAITFTNKAAREMQERVTSLMRGNQPELNISTFHSLGVRILRGEAKALGFKPNFSILDADDTFGILADLTRTTDKALIRRTQWQISAWKNAMLDAAGAAKVAERDMQGAAKIYREYQETLSAYQAFDFDDLIRLPAELLGREPAVLAKWRERLRYLLIDEYQDTNTCQYRLVRQLAGDSGAFTAVGDDDQAIYAWRGADVENLRALSVDFPALKVIKLEQNYRSTIRVLKAANNLIANNVKLFEKRLWSELGHGDAIEVLAARDEEHEAETVIMKLAAHRFHQGARFGDYAVLYRGNHQARPFEQFLRGQKIPYQVSGGQSFFDRAEIKDLIAYLRVIANSDDDPAFIRAITTPKRGVGAQTLEALGKLSGERHVSLFAATFDAEAANRIASRQLAPVTEFANFINNLQYRAAREPSKQVLDDLLKAIAYEQHLYDQEDAPQAEIRWSNVIDFVEWMSRRGEEQNKSMLEMTQHVALISMLDEKGDAADAVQLSTLHAAKGLEFKYVFLVGVEEGLLPHRESHTPEKLQEERRLMYVGITRAQRNLVVTYCEKRKRAREWLDCQPSRFIDEMGKGDLLFPDRNQVASKEDAAERIARLRAMVGQGSQETT